MSHEGKGHGVVEGSCLYACEFPLLICPMKEKVTVLWEGHACEFPLLREVFLGDN